MNCRYCGYKIPDGELYCEQCGKEVQIVPDYNPLDDVLAAQIKGSIDGSEAPLDNYEYKKVEEERRRYAQTTGRSRTSRNMHTSRTGDRNVPDAEQRRRQAEKKRARKRKRRIRAAIILGIFLLLFIILGIVFYQTSYTGLTAKGNKATSNREFEKAEGYYKKAIAKKPKKPAAYTGLSKVYIEQDNIDGAETLFLDAIDKYPDTIDLYEACIQFYVDTKQESEVSALLDDAPEKIRTELKVYVSGQPEFSLDDSVTYDDVQELSLSSSGKAIYYTTDGSQPTTASTKYTEPILLEEGETIVSAISVNKKGIPSLAAVNTYLIELPIEDAPAVTPSTGQYSKATQITVQVPEGYTAYYTLDKTDPTTASAKYEGPIDMPQGTTIIKVVLVNAKGRTSGITTRNYDLVLE